MEDNLFSGFPLHDVIFREVNELPVVKAPLYSAEGMQVNREEISLQAYGHAGFYISKGKEVLFMLSPGADLSQVRLFINSQVVVAILHQRGEINFHASSFIHGGRGIMILGETGAGKSSLTASFVLEGARLMSDDLTPVIFRGAKPYILALDRQIKLTPDTVEQLQISSDILKEAEPGTGKQYLNCARAPEKDFSLDVIFMVQTGKVSVPEFFTPEPAERFSILRSEICSWEMLAGMPATEALYLEQVLNIARQTQIIKVVRPESVRVPVMHVAILDYLEINK